MGVPEKLGGKGTQVGMLITKSMQPSENIICAWFSKQPAIKKSAILKNISNSMAACGDHPLEQLTSTVAAALMVACAEDLGLTSLELAGLLRNPRKDAMSGMVTVLRGV